MATSGAGGRDSVSAEAANTWYSAHLIRRPDTGALALLLHREKDYFLDETFTPANSAQTPLRDTTSAQKLSQGFQVDTTGKCEFVSVKINRQNSPAAGTYIWAEIWTDDGSGAPSSMIANARSDKLAAANIPAGVGLIQFIFRTPPSLTAGTQYHLVFDGDYTISATNYVAWEIDLTNTYSRGVARRWNGTTWTTISSDFVFALYITRNETAVALPTNYTQRALLGYVYNDGSSNLVGAIAVDRYTKFLADVASATFTTFGLVTIPAACPPVRVTLWTMVINNTASALTLLAGVPDGYAADVIGGAANAEAANVAGASGRVGLSPFTTEYQAVYAKAFSGTGTGYFRGFQW
jgi:hypothetical protein